MGIYRPLIGGRKYISREKQSNENEFSERLRVPYLLMGGGWGRGATVGTIVLDANGEGIRPTGHYFKGAGGGFAGGEKTGRSQGATQESYFLKFRWQDRRSRVAEGVTGQLVIQSDRVRRTSGDITWFARTLDFSTYRKLGRWGAGPRKGRKRKTGEAEVIRKAGRMNRKEFPKCKMLETEIWGRV